MTETVALDAFSRGLPRRCPSCSRPLDVPDLQSMEKLGICLWCEECTAPRRAQHGPEAVPFLARVSV